MGDVFINYEELKKDYKVNTNEEVLTQLVEEMIKVENEFEKIIGSTPFSAEELLEVKHGWREHDLKEVLTGNIEEDLELIKEYNRLNNL